MLVGGGGGHAHAYGAHMLYGRRIAGSGLMPAAFPFAGRVAPRFFFRIKGVPAIPQRCYFYASRVPLNGRRSIRATTASTASSSNSGGWGTEAKREGWVKLTPEQIAEYERAQEEATLQPHNEPEEGEEQEEQEEEEDEEEEEEEEEDEEEWNNWEEDEEEDEEEEVEDEEWGVRDDEDDKTEEQNGDKDSLTGEQEEMLTAKHEWSPEDRDIPLFARKIRQHLRRHNPEVFQEIERIGEEAAPQTEDEEKEKEGEEEEVTKTHKFFQQHTVSKNEAGMRLDRWLREKFPELPLTLFQRLLRKKKITINSDFRIEKYVYKPYEENKALKGHKVEGSYHIALGDVIILPSSLFSEELHQQKLREGQAAKQNRVMIPLTEGEIQLVKSWVLYQDDRIIAINKPPGLPVQGGTDITEYYLDRFLPALQDDYEDPPRLVHRLDKECSGVLLLGRTRKDADYLAKLFRNKKLLRKEYWAVCAGVPNAKQGRLETPLIKAGKKMIALEAMEKGAKMAVSRYKLLESAGPELSFLALYPWTGRKHQLRVQCASVLKTPILGDTKYAHNDEDKFSLILGKIEKLHLHCRSIELPHPQKKNVRLRIFASPPPHMMHTLKEFDWTEAVPKQLSLQSRLAT